jgi:hypothetical protein
VVEGLPTKHKAVSSNPSITKKEKKKKKQKAIYVLSIYLSDCQVLVAQTCNSSYLGDRDQEDQGPRASW